MRWPSARDWPGHRSPISRPETSSRRFMRSGGSPMPSVCHLVSFCRLGRDPGHNRCQAIFLRTSQRAPGRSWSVLNVRARHQHDEGHDLLKADAEALRILRDAGITSPPVDVYRLARDLGATILKDDLDPE